jgi:1,4-dihydroxy-2-naphthoyl-CoA hydrolase
MSTGPTSTASDPRRTADAFNRARAPYLLKLGIELEEVGSERVVGTMPVLGNTQGVDTLHGGATMSLVETLASVGAESQVGTDQLVVGQDQTCHFIGAAFSGTVRGIATPIHRGSRSQVWDVDVTHVESGKRIAAGRVTIAICERRRERAPAAR